MQHKSAYGHATAETQYKIMCNIILHLLPLKRSAAKSQACHRPNHIVLYKI